MANRRRLSTKLALPDADRVHARHMHRCAQVYVTRIATEAAEQSWGYQSTFWRPFSFELWLGVLASLVLVAISYVVAENLACMRRATLQSQVALESLGAEEQVRRQLCALSHPPVMWVDVMAKG